MNIGEYAYVRVSTKDQSEARQLIAMQKLGLRNENIYIEKRSGKDFDRPKYPVSYTHLTLPTILRV